ncbi:MAG TPA: ABC transporter permease subunit [Candidatus Limnocylindria bacterium]|nr:ABC transporter permease subunit [Candidatus Limnocylindria bacterium]
MTGFGPMLRKELLEQWRTKRLLVVAIVFIALGISSPFLARYIAEIIEALGDAPFEIEMPEPTIADAVSQFLRNLGQAGILTAVLLSMGSVATEKERGTAALFLSKPVGRGAFLAAKLVAIGTTLVVGLVLAAIAGYAYTTLLFEAPSVGGWLGMTGMLLLSLLAYAALTFLGSTLTRSAIAAAGIGVGGMILLAMVATIPSIAPYLPAGISGSPAAAVALGLDPGPLLGPILANLGLTIGLGVLSWLAFRHQEL